MIGVTTIGEILEDNCCIMGKDLKELLGMILESSEDETEKAWATQIHEDYWVNNGDILPISTAYYYLWVNKQGAIRIRRDVELSPRVADFMNLATLEIDPDIYAEDDKYTEGDLRTIIALNLAVRGTQLGELCQAILDDTLSAATYGEYQKQLAQAILDKYYTDEFKKPKDSYYYKVQVKQVGIPNVVRDLDRSPRPLSAAEKEWNAAHPDDI